MRDAADNWFSLGLLRLLGDLEGDLDAEFDDDGDDPPTPPFACSHIATAARTTCFYGRGC